MFIKDTKQFKTHKKSQVRTESFLYLKSFFQKHSPTVFLFHRKQNKNFHSSISHLQSQEKNEVRTKKQEPLGNSWKELWHTIEDILLHSSLPSFS